LAKWPSHFISDKQFQKGQMATLEKLANICELNRTSDDSDGPTKSDLELIRLIHNYNSTIAYFTLKLTNLQVRPETHASDD